MSSKRELGPLERAAATVFAQDEAAFEAWYGELMGLLAPLPMAEQCRCLAETAEKLAERAGQDPERRALWQAIASGFRALQTSAMAAGDG